MWSLQTKTPLAFGLQSYADMKTCIFIFAALAAMALSPSCSSKNVHGKQSAQTATATSSVAIDAPIVTLCQVSVV
jgi:hypothetical protein